MRAAVIGGSGYFGSVLLSRLERNGYDCSNIDIIQPVQHSRAVFKNVNILDAEALEAALVGAEIVFHSAAQVPLEKDSVSFKNVNIEGTRNVLSVVERLGIAKTIFVSSSAVYGKPSALPVSPRCLPKPAEAYGRTKLEAEVICKQFMDLGVDVSIIRPRTILGPGRMGIFEILFEWVFQGKTVPILGDGSNIFQFIHGDDLAEACLKASELPGPDTFNCGAKEFGTMKQVLQQLIDYSGSGSRLRPLPKNLSGLGIEFFSKLGLVPLGAYHALMYGESFYFDTQYSRAKLNWNPRFSNQEMFQAAFDWYVDNRSRIRNAGASYSHHRSPVKRGLLDILNKFL